jgi:hypothetical protein
MAAEVKCHRCGLSSGEHDFESDCVQAQHEEIQRLEDELKTARRAATKELELAKKLLCEVLSGADILTDRKWKRAVSRLLS